MRTLYTVFGELEVILDTGFNGGEDVDEIDENENCFVCMCECYTCHCIVWKFSS